MDMPELALFVARASSEEEGWQDYLRNSLLYTRNVYVRHYGPLSEELPFLVFAQSSNRRFPSDPVPRTITALLTRGRETGRPVVLVINGWDGLSTNPIVLVDLFEAWINEVDITLRVFAGNPRRFFEVSVVHAIEAIRGDYEDDDEAPVLPSDTKIFVDKVHAYYLMGITRNSSPPSAAVPRGESRLNGLSEARSSPSEIGDGGYSPSMEDPL
ncbi:hypothetical protein F9C07_1733479 [Aspergillus flavus]|uniref:Uncharacterized protein n=1 Tax=Aspergillus flavus (strain ATCC 200026 / FGSC A1120 / IAM 13836 / NRRL 3357 / JCM 12722 / SRRC 167) TaxID=332952 RepID=A0A7U2R2S3_ASPFN|nr:uncharacterized protein G4B84_010037 [Aspergillus flavus NRRL3357]KAF7622042.1 hypothetical protein AFLA_008590 [Aspergillus flavus NRRL3357]QMW34571.1 hypothetical protein G4B84_010037 [Aspergillus flavus NRRL3357]QRD93629.1 hypothetical protein F9C07_1733479 [Aspergillus flavus]